MQGEGVGRTGPINHNATFAPEGGCRGFAQASGQTGTPASRKQRASLLPRTISPRQGAEGGTKGELVAIRNPALPRAITA